MNIEQPGGRRLAAAAIRAGLILTLASFSLHAQYSDFADNRGEVNIYTGLGFGGATGTRPAVGASTGVNLNRYSVLLLGSSFMPMDNRTLVPHILPTSRSHLYDSNFTLNVQIPVRHRWFPYGLASTSVLYNTYQLQQFRPNGETYFIGEGDVKFAFEAGGGLRYDVGEDWGVRGEYRYVISTQDFSRLVFGVYYRLPSDWPFLFRARAKSRTNHR